MDAPDLLWGLLSLPGQWRRLSVAPRLLSAPGGLPAGGGNQGNGPECQAGRGGKPRSLVLSVGLMSGPGALLQMVTALCTCPPAVRRTWPCVLSTLRPEARRRSEQAEAPAQDSVPSVPGRPSHPDTVLTWGPWPQLFGLGQRSSGLAVTPAAQRAQKFLGWKLPKPLCNHWGPAPGRREEP